jgi:hypothetical protein
MLALANNLAANAEARGMSADDMVLYASAHRGPSLLRSRHKRGFGMRLKVAHVHMVLAPPKAEKK